MRIRAVRLRMRNSALSRKLGLAAVQDAMQMEMSSKPFMMKARHHRVPFVSSVQPKDTLLRLNRDY